MSDAMPARPTRDDDRKGWKAYWAAQAMPWRTEPEIDAERQQYLAERRAVTQDIERGIYPFRDENGSIKLTRADVEWLLAKHESCGTVGPVDWSEESGRQREGLDLRGADLRSSKSQVTDLKMLPLARLRGGLTGNEWLQASPEQREMVAVHLEGVDLRLAHLEDACLCGAHLEEATLHRAWLEQADFYHVYADGCSLAETFAPSITLTEASLRGAILNRAHLVDARLSAANMEKAELHEVHLEGASLVRSYMCGAFLLGAHLERAGLVEARLEGAMLQEAQLSGASLVKAHLEGTDLSYAHLEGTQLSADTLENLRTWIEGFPRELMAANLTEAFFDSATILEGVMLGSKIYGAVRVLDVRWGGVNLAVTEWSQPNPKLLRWHISQIEAIELGEEREARTARDTRGKAKDNAQRRTEYENAVRANRQLATALRNQGLNEDADRFAYKAQKLQREVLHRQPRWGAYLGSCFLCLVAGYGYKPLRAFATYASVIVFFTILYLINSHFVAPHLLWNEALVLSVSSFHGRGFFNPNIQLGDTYAQLAAAEAIIGLFIEISFIATFTQRFFNAR